MLYLRLRAAAEDSGLPIIEMTSQETHVSSFDSTASATLSRRRGTAGSMARSLEDRSKPDRSCRDGAWDAALGALRQSRR